MQIVFLVLVYFLAAVVNNRSLKKKHNYQPSEKINWRGISLKQAVLAIFIGIMGVMALDLSSQGEPIWPALALVVVVTGEMYPFWKSAQEQKTGIFSYFGGLVYLNPTMALLCLGLALEILLIGKDNLLAILVFIGLVPILIWYSQTNITFLWITIGIELLIIWGLKTELWNKIKP